MKAYAFFHIATIGAYQAVVDELMDAVMGSGLIDRLEGLECVVCGDKPVRIQTHPKIHVEHAREDVTKFEFPTLQRVHRFAKEHQGTAILYFHTKGVSHPDNPCIVEWRQYMAYFCLEKWKEAIDRLDEADTAGVDFSAFQINGMGCTSDSITYFGTDLHYSGNFWWANSDYLATLPELDDTKDRHACEFWISKARGNHCCLWNSRIPIMARQHFRCPRESYA